MPPAPPTTMHTPDPHYRERTLAAFAHQPWAEHLGMEATDAGPGWFTIRCPLQAFHRQHDGLVHGGVLATLADTAAALAAYTLAAPGQRIVTVEFKINYLRPAAGDALLCRGSVLRPGRTITVSEAEIFSLDGETRLLVAKALATIAILPGDPNGESGLRV